MALEEGKIRIKRFYRSNFGYWKMQIEDFLRLKKLHKTLMRMKQKDMTNKEWEKLDGQTLSCVWLMLARNVTFNIMKENTTKGLMDTLTKMYENLNVTNKVHDEAAI